MELEEDAKGEEGEEDAKGGEGEGETGGEGREIWRDRGSMPKRKEKCNQWWCVVVMRRLD